MKNYLRIAFVMAIVSFVIFTIIIFQIETGSPLLIDQIITNALASLPEKMNPFFIAMTGLGSKKGIGIISLLMVLWLWIRKKNFAGMAALVFAVALGNEASKLLKKLFGRPRPEGGHLVEVNSLSFPSGHAMVGMILFTFCAYLLVKYLKKMTAKMAVVIGAIVLILLVGFSRVVLHVHYPSDVIGGYILGYLWVYVWIILYEKYGKLLNRTT